MMTKGPRLCVDDKAMSCSGLFGGIVSDNGDDDDQDESDYDDGGDHDALYKGQFRCGYDEETRTKKIGQRAIEMRGGGGGAEETFFRNYPLVVYI